MNWYKKIHDYQNTRIGYVKYSDITLFNLNDERFNDKSEAIQLYNMILNQKCSEIKPNSVAAIETIFDLLSEPERAHESKNSYHDK